jgi:outer membrane protein TolC
MRWKTMVTGLALALASAVGCKQQCFLAECDYDHYVKDLGLPPNLPCDPSVSVTPSISQIAAPATVMNPERPVRYLSLAEAIAMSLEHGTPGSPSLNGTTNPSLLTFAGRAVFDPQPNIRALSVDPAIAADDIEASLAKFDARWVTSMNWSVTDEPTGNNVLQSFQNGDHATFASSLLKPLPTGGVAGITFTTAYTNLTQPTAGIVNPAYRPNLQFQFEQPLLQGFGVETNQLRSVHPGSLLTPFQTNPLAERSGGPVEGILITRLRFDQQRAEFEYFVNTMVVNVEVAYWNLYGSYWALYSREQALRQAFEAWKINRERFEAGRIAIQDVAQTRQQYELFRAQRLQALGTVIDNERNLRTLVGLPIEDGSRLVPVDTPTLAPYQPDWSTSINEALALRPELVLARQDVKFRQLDLINVQDALKPDLRFTSTYNINSIGTHIDGGPSDPNNAFSNLAKDQFNDWSLGLRLDVPLGFRDAHAAIRSARLNLARSYTTLKDQENKTHQFLGQQYANVIEFYELIRAQRAQREAAAVQLGARFKEFLAGRGTLDFLLEAQRVWADALRDEFNAIYQYNSAIATFEYAKGTLLQHDNVVIGEGVLPHCAQVRAVEHERERTKALVLRERAQPVNHCNFDGAAGTVPGVPDLSTASLPSVPSLLASQPAAVPTASDAASAAPEARETSPGAMPAKPGYR